MPITNPKPDSHNCARLARSVRNAKAQNLDHGTQASHDQSPSPRRLRSQYPSTIVRIMTNSAVASRSSTRISSRPALQPEQERQNDRWKGRASSILVETLS
jgi:hypothetical protein